jgi:hypothetical protein
MDPAASGERAAPTVTDLVAAFTGDLVLVEPLSLAHERGLARAAREQEVFAWLPENVETKLLLLTHAFEHAGLRRVEFKTDARNERSRGALQALGAKFEGILRKHMVVRGGEPRDSAYYSVIDDEWPALKTHLQQRLADLRNPSAT